MGGKSHIFHNHIWTSRVVMAGHTCVFFIYFQCSYYSCRIVLFWMRNSMVVSCLLQIHAHTNKNSSTICMTSMDMCFSSFDELWCNISHI